jgi:hypothetical protein
MARVKQSSRRLFLGAAFICVMAGSGALFGAIAGLMLILLTHSMLRIDGGILPVILASGALGMVAAILWSLLLVVRSAHGTLALVGENASAIGRS